MTTVSKLGIKVHIYALIGPSLLLMHDEYVRINEQSQGMTKAGRQAISPNLAERIPKMVSLYPEKKSAFDYEHSVLQFHIFVGQECVNKRRLSEERIE